MRERKCGGIECANGSVAEWNARTEVWRKCGGMECANGSVAEL
jgi:hypothetical protein